MDLVENSYSIFIDPRRTRIRGRQDVLLAIADCNEAPSSYTQQLGLRNRLKMHTDLASETPNFSGDAANMPHVQRLDDRWAQNWSHSKTAPSCEELHIATLVSQLRLSKEQSVELTLWNKIVDLFIQPWTMTVWLRR